MAQNYKSQVQAALHYWQRKTEGISQKNMVWLDERRANLLQSIEEGLKVEVFWEETAVVIIQVFSFMEWHGYWQSWIPVLEKIIKKAVDPQVKTYMQLNSQLSQFYRLDRRFAEAEKRHQFVLKYITKTKNDEMLAGIYHEISHCFLDQNQFEEAERYALLALTHIEQDSGSKRLEAFILQTLGTIKRIKGDTKVALVYIEPALAIRRELEETVLLADTLNELARTYEDMQLFAMAHKTIDEALLVINQTNHESMKSLFLMNKGVFYYRQNQLAEAEKMFSQQNFFALKRQGNLHQCGLAMQNLGNVLFDQGKILDAEPYIQEAVQLFRATKDEIHLANSLGTLGQILGAQNKSAEAGELFDEALTFLEKYPENAWAKKLKANFLEQKKLL